MLVVCVLARFSAFVIPSDDGPGRGAGKPATREIVQSCNYVAVLLRLRCKATSACSRHADVNITGYTDYRRHTDSRSLRLAFSGTLRRGLIALPFARDL